MNCKLMTLSEYIDRKRQLEVEIAQAVETAVVRFEQSTGTKVMRAHVERIDAGLWTSTVEVML